MKRYFTFALALCFCMALSAQNLFVGTYNIRNHNSSDDSKGNVWAKRCQVICDQINFEDPDIFGTQEVLVGQLHDLLKGFDGYGYVGVGRCLRAHLLMGRVPPERDGLPLLLLQSPHGPRRHCGSPRGCQAGGEED